MPPTKAPAMPAPESLPLPEAAPPAKARPSDLMSRFQRAKVSGERIGLYGTGGIGKTSLALAAPGPVVVIDLDDSIGRLAPETPVLNPASWKELMDKLASPIWDGVKTIILDSTSVAEDLCLAHVLQTIRNEKGQPVRRIEDYGYGKGYRYLYDEFLPLLYELDRHRLDGRNIILISHQITVDVPNPQGDDYIRWEPRLQGNEKHSVRLRVKEWLDHLFFLGYDVNVKENKGQGSGTRTIYTQEMPHCLAKCRAGVRNIPESLEYEFGSAEIWRLLFPESFTTINKG